MAADAKKTVLIVDDEAILAMAEAKTLEKHGYTVMTAFSGDKAVALMDEHPEIDLVLMDIDLGDGIDGTQIAERILKKKSLPLLFLSGHTEPDIVARTERITSSGYVVKNSGETVLLASLRMAFRLHEENLNVVSALSSDVTNQRHALPRRKRNSRIRTFSSRTCSTA